LVLYEAAKPLRLLRAVEGVFRNGESSAYAAFDSWENAPRIRISARAVPVTVNVRVGTLAQNPSAPTMGRVTYTKDVTLRRPGSFSVPVPPAPFRIEVRYRSGRRGTLEFLPRR
jgi:hypothetical protein